MAEVTWFAFNTGKKTAKPWVIAKPDGIFYVFLRDKEGQIRWFASKQRATTVITKLKKGV